MLAESVGRSLGHGLRDDCVEERRADRLPVLRGGDPLPCATDLHQGQPAAGEAQLHRGQVPAPADAAPGAAPASAVCAVQVAAGSTPGARRHRLRDPGDAHRLRCRPQDFRDPADPAQRRPQADRGVHALRQRGHRALPLATRDPGALPHPRWPAERAPGQAAAVPRRTGAYPQSRQERADPQRLPGPAGKGARASGLPPDPDGDAAFPQPGGVQPR
ncbi:hypothetical protein D9M71_460270 [compost metagenome]